MNKPNLSEIYRNGVQSGSDANADVDQVIAQIPRSPLQRDLIRFARDLEPESAALSANLESALDGGAVIHRRRVAAQRSAHGRRRWRVASALAASLIAAIAIWNVGRPNHSHMSPSVTMVDDRIFSSRNDESMATKSSTGHDEIFQGDFRTDEIFNASRHNNG